MRCFQWLAKAQTHWNSVKIMLPLQAQSTATKQRILLWVLRTRIMELSFWLMIRYCRRHQRGRGRCNYSQRAKTDPDTMKRDIIICKENKQQWQCANISMDADRGCKCY